MPEKSLQNATEPLQNATNTPYIKKYHNIQKGGGVKGSTTTGTTTLFQESPSFAEWWGLYAGEGLWQGLRLQTEKKWQSLNPDERRQAYRHTQIFASANRKRKSPKLPNWYLTESIRLEPLAETRTPVFLSGVVAGENMSKKNSSSPRKFSFFEKKNLIACTFKKKTVILQTNFDN